MIRTYVEIGMWSPVWVLVRDKLVSIDLVTRHLIPVTIAGMMVCSIIIVIMGLMGKVTINALIAGFALFIASLMVTLQPVRM